MALAAAMQLRDAQGKLQAEGQEQRYQQALVKWAEQEEEQVRGNQIFRDTKAVVVGTTCVHAEYTNLS